MENEQDLLEFGIIKKNLEFKCRACDSSYSTIGNLKKHLRNSTKCQTILSLLKQIESCKKNATNFKELLSTHKLIYTTDKNNISKLLNSSERIMYSIVSASKNTAEITEYDSEENKTIVNYLFSNESGGILKGFRDTSIVWNDVTRITLSVLYKVEFAYYRVSEHDIQFGKENNNRLLELDQGVPLAKFPDHLWFCISLEIEGKVESELEVETYCLNWNIIEIEDFEFFGKKIEIDKEAYTRIEECFVEHDAKYFSVVRKNLYIETDLLVLLNEKNNMTKIGPPFTSERGFTDDFREMLEKIPGRWPSDNERNTTILLSLDIETVRVEKARIVISTSRDFDIYLEITPSRIYFSSKPRIGLFTKRWFSKEHAEKLTGILSNRTISSIEFGKNKFWFKLGGETCLLDFSNDPVRIEVLPGYQGKTNYYKKKGFGGRSSPERYKKFSELPSGKIQFPEEAFWTKDENLKIEDIIRNPYKATSQEFTSKLATMPPSSERQTKRVRNYQECEAAETRLKDMKRDEDIFSTRPTFVDLKSENQHTKIEDILENATE